MAMDNTSNQLNGKISELNHGRQKIHNLNTPLISQQKTETTQKPLRQKLLSWP